MSGTAAGYDLSVSTLSPDGHVFQVEYATKAVDTAPTVVGAVCSDGIVFLADSVLCGYTNDENVSRNVLQARPVLRLYALDEGVGCAITGMIPDAQCIVRRAKAECKSFFEEYGVKIPISLLAERVALFVHAYTLYWHVRPFGASTILSGVDSNGEKSLYCIEPSGACYKYTGMAIGKCKHLVKTEMEKLNLSGINCRDALRELSLAIMIGRDEDSGKTNDIQMAWICLESNGVFQMVPDEVVKETKCDASRRHATIHGH
ncbi:Proteasome subunit alpha type-3 [Babesia sp. Xinjiang]|uniref:Proteasome subunit alpha type-3 n=1 Tax=Babesia sp. Xinjiang TaxID=462227 RepID=UPI000A2371E3|nr:Proteasome subunit alpha type-3 [Babesia sp. Xinjiang]ORM40252.1 Proteasome subunit alpha type-3 [Babesia sp. Xinjiang]